MKVPMFSVLYGPPELVAVLAARPPRFAFVERVTACCAQDVLMLRATVSPADQFAAVVSHSTQELPEAWVADENAIAVAPMQKL